MMTRRMTRPDAVRAEMRYVPGSSGRPWTLPRKGTRFKPARPATLKWPTPWQLGETWLTVKMTRVGLERANVRVVVRRFFGPVVPIHGREELKCSTRDPPAPCAPALRDPPDEAAAELPLAEVPLAEVPVAPAPPPEPEVELPATVPAAELTSDEAAEPAEPAAPVEPVADVVDGVWAGAGGGEATTGAGSVGTLGSGTGDEGSGTEGVVTVTGGGGGGGSGGSGSAAAVPATAAATATTTHAPSAFTVR
jgi:hypothetical protein